MLGHGGVSGGRGGKEKSRLGAQGWAKAGVRTEVKVRLGWGQARRPAGLGPGENQGQSYR